VDKVVVVGTASAVSAPQQTADIHSADPHPLPEPAITIVIVVFVVLE